MLLDSQDGIYSIAQNSAAHPGLFLSLVALNLKSRESKDAKKERKWPKTHRTTQNGL